MNRLPRKASKNEIDIKKRIIKESALDLLAYKGYDDTAMTEIADKAGISVGTVYIYFSNKLELYECLYEDALDALEKSFDDVIAAPAHDATSRMSLMLFSYINFYKYQNANYRILSSGFWGKKVEIRNNQTIKDKSINILKNLEKQVIWGVETGEFKPCDTFKLVTTLWAMFDGILMMNVKTQIDPIAEKYDEYYSYGIETVLNGILTVPSSNKEKK